MAAEIFQLLGKIGLDGVEETNKQIDGVGDKAGKLGKVFDKAGQVALGVGKAVAVGFGAASVAITGIIKSSVDAYAEYEQLVGGAELMFGDAYSFIADKAANAYATVQMSQSEYLQQVNGFAVGLKTALNGDAQAAAELADKIITAEADIVAATGQSAEAVQNAFNGIMKGNFTMLDNLQIGITPTKQGFMDLIKTVNAWNKANGRATNYTINNIADCQAALVDYIAMQGMAGYASAEAMETIEGSTAATKAAWQNLVTGFADEEQNLEKLVDDFVNTAVVMIGNIGNRVQEILPRLVEGLGSLIEALSPHLKDFMTTMLPGLIEGASILLVGLIEALPNILQILIEQIPFILTTIGEALVEAFPVLLETIKELFGQIWEYIGEELLGVETDFDDTFAVVEDLFNSVWESCQYIWDEIGKPIFDAMSEIFGKAKEALQPFIDKVTEYVTEGELANDITETVKNAVDFLVGAYESAVDIVNSVVEGFQNAVAWGKEHETGLTLIAAAVGILTAAIVAYNIAQGIKNAGGIIELAQLAATAIGVGALTVAETAHTVATTIATAATTAFGAAMAFLTSPITLIVAGIGALIAIIVLLVKNWDTVKAKALEVWAGIKEAFGSAADWFNEKVVTPISEFFTNLGEGIKQAFKAPINFIIEQINGFIRGINNIKIPDWVPVVGGKGFSISEIPLLAKGGVLEKGQVGFLEGNGAEAVVPLDQNKKWINQVAMDMNAAIGGTESADLLRRILDAITAMDDAMAEKLTTAVADIRLDINNREFARMVRAVN